jgi:hypothetical protein
MSRHAILYFLIFACVASLSCQQYATGLKQDVERANEMAAIAALHSIATAQRSYAATNGGEYGTFQQLTQGDYLDSRFTSDKPELAGYVFSMLTQKSEGEPPRFSCNADPTRASGPASRHFYIDSDSVQMHVNPIRPATVDDPASQP